MGILFALTGLTLSGMAAAAEGAAIAAPIGAIEAYGPLGLFTAYLIWREQRDWALRQEHHKDLLKVATDQVRTTTEITETLRVLTKEIESNRKQRQTETRVKGGED